MQSSFQTSGNSSLSEVHLNKGCHDANEDDNVFISNWDARNLQRTLPPFKVPPRFAHLPRSGSYARVIDSGEKIEYPLRLRLG